MTCDTCVWCASVVRFLLKLLFICFSYFIVKFFHTWSIAIHETLFMRHLLKDYELKIMKK